MALRQEAAEHPDVKGGVLASAMRSLRRPSAQGLTTTFVRSLRTVSTKSPSGLLLGRAAGYEPDAPRLMRVIDRILRGLYFHQTRQPLGLDVGVKTIEDTLTDLAATAPADIDRLTEIVRALGRSGWRDVGSAFSYAAWLSPDERTVSAWLMRFYGSTAFFSLTAPPARNSKKD